jgi:hypothetical protein
MFASGLAQAEPSKVIGNWKVEITFSNGESRSVRFEAQDAGKGSLVFVSPNPAMGGQSAPSTAEWTQGEQGSVTFSGPIQFPLGNVGLLRGTLVLKGKMETNSSITGEAKFYPSDQDPKDPKAQPSKSGSFTATRVAG